jgi:carboxyl-terminal processing protease
MVEEYGDGTTHTYNALGDAIAPDIPLVVLVNEGSASASEITAGAIQDRSRGTLVGMTTYGKGSVQNWIELDGDNGAIRVTIARWLTPDSRQINDVGLTPDVQVDYPKKISMPVWIRNWTKRSRSCWQSALMLHKLHLMG